MSSLQARIATSKLLPELKGPVYIQPKGSLRTKFPAISRVISINSSVTLICFFHKSLLILNPGPALSVLEATLPIATLRTNSARSWNRHLYYGTG
jgi:hypothetical protein